MSQATLSLRGRNPDILSCIANLSNDEVFTPPEFAQRMLDTLTEAWAADNGGASIWENAEVTFLDPCTKSGVFLREISKRLIKGLAPQIPDLQTRVDHILTRQIFGIGITKLTAMLARRSLYCSKQANGPYSIAGKTAFDSEMGNIWFERVEHSWRNDRCVFCGASQSTFDQGETRESHAYAFIHSDNIRARLAALFGDKMQFDVIIGNPPYQLQDRSDSASATPIYHLFIEQAITLEPRYLAMVTPSRWFTGGKGLTRFRNARLNDKKLKVLVDFVVDKDAFPSINVNGGINYFLWSKEHSGDCTVVTVERGGIEGAPVKRVLNEFDVFVRRDASASILRKIQAFGEPTFNTRVSSRKPFGLATKFFGKSNRSHTANIKLYSSGKITWVHRSLIKKNFDWIDQWKVLIPRASDGNETYPLPIWDSKGPFVSGPGEACTETYLVASVVSSEVEAKSICRYMRTKFFRYLVSLRKMTQDNKADLFSFVPDLRFEGEWTDQDLFDRYGISEEEQEHIHEMIRTMELDRSDSLAEGR